MSPGSGRFWPTTPSTVRVTPVDRWTSITTTMTVLRSRFQVPGSRFSVLLAGFRVFAFVNDAALEPARLVDDAFEEPPDGVGAERPFAGHLAHVLQHVLFAIGLIDVHALGLFQPSDFTHASCALVEQTDQHFVHPIDVSSQFIERHIVHACGAAHALLSDRIYSS